MPLRTMTALPRVGPVWYGAVMSTGAAPVMALSYLGDGSGSPASVGATGVWGDVVIGVAFLLWLVAVGVFCLLTTLFGVRSALEPAEFRTSWGAAAQVLPWGSVAIGFLSLGSATPLVLPAIWPGTFAVARAAMWPLWLVGTGLGLACGAVFLRRVRQRRAGSPSLGWGLAVMPTLVGSNVTAELGTLYPGSALAWGLAALSAAQFALGLMGAVTVFGVGYWWVFRHRALELSVVPTAFMPVGLAGQSAASSQQQARNLASVAPPGFANFVQEAAVWQSYLLFPLGGAALLFAALVFVRGLGRAMPYTPAWLAMPYPTASLAAGLSGVGAVRDSAFLMWSGAFVAVVFAALWVGSSAVTLVAVFRFRDQWIGMYRVANLGPYLRERLDARQGWRRPSGSGSTARAVDDELGVPRIAEREVTFDD